MHTAAQNVSIPMHWLHGWSLLCTHRMGRHVHVLPARYLLCLPLLSIPPTNLPAPARPLQHRHDQRHHHHPA